MDKNYSITIPVRTGEKTGRGIADAMRVLHKRFVSKFSDVFRTITTGNGNEFATFSEFETLGTNVYFAHPYSAWERPVNERTNQLLRKFISKGVFIHDFSNEQILMFSDEINALPCKRLGYRTPEELFDDQLDLIYTVP